MPSLDALRFANEANPPVQSLGLKVVERITNTISSGVTGTLFTSPEILDGQIIRLVHLLTDDGNPQGGITLIADGYTLLDDVLLGDVTPTTESFGVNLFSISSGANIYDGVFCKTFTVSKSTGITTLPIKYTYDIMENIV